MAVVPAVGGGVVARLTLAASARLDVQVAVREWVPLRAVCFRCARMSALCHRIERIVAPGAGEYVGRINAGRIVTSMASIHFIRDGLAIRQLPCYSVRPPRRAIHLELAITIPVHSTCPRPAFIRFTNIYFRPEPFLKTPHCHEADPAQKPKNSPAPNTTIINQNIYFSSTRILPLSGHTSHRRGRRSATRQSCGGSVRWVQVQRGSAR